MGSSRKKSSVDKHHFPVLPKLDLKNNDEWLIFAITWVLSGQSEESEVSTANLMSTSQDSGKEMHLK